MAVHRIWNFAEFDEIDGEFYCGYLAAKRDCPFSYLNKYEQKTCILDHYELDYLSSRGRYLCAPTCKDIVSGENERRLRAQCAEWESGVSDDK